MRVETKTIQLIRHSVIRGLSIFRDLFWHYTVFKCNEERSDSRSSIYCEQIYTETIAPQSERWKEEVLLWSCNLRGPRTYTSIVVSINIESL